MNRLKGFVLFVLFALASGHVSGEHSIGGGHTWSWYDKSSFVFSGNRVQFENTAFGFQFEYDYIQAGWGVGVWAGFGIWGVKTDEATVSGETSGFAFTNQLLGKIQYTFPKIRSAQVVVGIAEGKKRFSLHSDTSVRLSGYTTSAFAGLVFRPRKRLTVSLKYNRGYDDLIDNAGNEFKTRNHTLGVSVKAHFSYN